MLLTCTLICFFLFSFHCFYILGLSEKVRAHRDAKDIIITPVGLTTLSISYNYNMTLLLGKNRLSVMPTYRRMSIFNILVHLLGLLAIHNHNLASYSILVSLQQNECLAYKDCMHINPRKLVLLENATIANVRFLSVTITCFSAIDFALLQTIIKLCSGDVHTNPGPSSTSSLDSTSNSSSSVSATILSSLKYPP